MLVAPYAGAWIEIICSPDVFVCNVVAPYAGAWIEILDNLSSDVLPDGSLPTRERLPTPRFNNLSEPFAK